MQPWQNVNCWANWERIDTNDTSLLKHYKQAAHSRACCSIVPALTHCFHAVTHGEVKMLSLLVSFNWTSPLHHCYTTSCEESSSNGGIITGSSRSPNFLAHFVFYCYFCWELFSTVLFSSIKMLLIWCKDEEKVAYSKHFTHPVARLPDKWGEFYSETLPQTVNMSQCVTPQDGLNLLCWDVFSINSI